VHHARNPIYAGKNFGFVLIVWDKLFGTFQPELATVPPVYGIEDGPASFNPVIVSFHHLGALARRPRDAALARQAAPRLHAGGLAAPAAPPRAQAEAPPRPHRMIAIGLVHVAYLALAVGQLTTTIGDHALSANLRYLAMVMLGTGCLGMFFDGDRRWFAFEVARAALSAGVIATGAWFARPLDLATAGLLVATGAMLAVAAFRRRG
jgi:hypothetical protein